MPRVIKFRQWTGNRFYFWGVGIEGNTFVGPASGGGMNAANTDHQQFTGLTDKIGKEIYEGDILEVPTRRQTMWHCIVKFEEGGFKALPTIDPEDGFNLIDVVDCPVIGNIYESPELLQ